MGYSIDLPSAKVAAEAAARSVGTTIRDAVRSKRQNEIHHKGRIDIATDLDLKIEAELSAVLLAEFPESRILGEEGSSELQKKSGESLQALASRGAVWVLDPIDGTNNFSNHIPHVAVSIGLMVDG
jgi:myo-inositol-1(or 4)-monophosphatase